MNEVILGMPGPWAVNKCEAYDHYTTKIGGLPDWPFQKSSLPPDLLLCSSCGSNTCLVAQVYAPIYNSTIKIEERTIYVFCCTSLSCRSCCAFRVQKSTSPTNVSSDGISGSLQLNDHILLGLEDDEDDMDGDDLDLEKLQMAFSQVAITASVSTKQNTPKKSKSSEKVLARKIGEVDSHSLVLPCFYTYDEVEKSSKDVTSTSASYSSLSIKEKQSEKDSHAEEEAWEGESYEYESALFADRTYLKFKKRMEIYPVQCFRYAFGGKPLLASIELSDPGSCNICGGARHYEMQLMSPLLYFLQEAANGHEKKFLDGWNWMTLLLYTCSKSCSEEADPDGWVIGKECVIAQVERLPKVPSEFT